MKILWFTNTQISSNTVGESWVQALMSQLVKKENIELGIASMSNVHEIEEEIIFNKVHIYKLPRNTGIRKGKLKFRFHYFFNNDKAIEDYLDVVSRFNPDIIQIFGSENNFGLIIPKIKIPVVIHIQGILSVYLEKYFSGIPKSDILNATLIKEKINRSGLLDYYKFFKQRAKIEEEVLSETKFVFGRTMWDRRTTRILAPKAHYLRCEEVIRPVFFENHWKNPQNINPRFISVMRNNPYKGMDTIIKTALLLNSKKFNFTWEIIGATETDQINNILKNIFRINYQSQNIIFRGNMNGDEIAETMLKSDIFIQPSHIENSPNSVCEAMVLGIPVISSFAGGTVDLLKTDEEGILIQDGDPYVLAGAILELSEDDEKKTLFSYKSRQRAIERHNPEKITESLIENYNTIIRLYRNE